MKDMDKCKALIQKLFILCHSNGKTTIDPIGFKNAVEKRMENPAHTTLELLETFDSFDIETKLEVISECAEIKDSAPIGESILERSLANEERKLSMDMYCEPVMFHANDFNTEEDLKKRIKYSKNPLEKKRLQRELDVLRFDNGKHRRGTKRRKK